MSSFNNPDYILNDPDFLFKPFLEEHISLFLEKNNLSSNFSINTYHQFQNLLFTPVDFNDSHPNTFYFHFENLSFIFKRTKDIGFIHLSQTTLPFKDENDILLFIQCFDFLEELLTSKKIISSLVFHDKSYFKKWLSFNNKKIESFISQFEKLPLKLKKTFVFFLGEPTFTEEYRKNNSLYLTRDKHFLSVFSKAQESLLSLRDLTFLTNLKFKTRFITGEVFETGSHFKFNIQINFLNETLALLSEKLSFTAPISDFSKELPVFIKNHHLDNQLNLITQTDFHPFIKKFRRDSKTLDTPFFLNNNQMNIFNSLLSKKYSYLDLNERYTEVFNSASIFYCSEIDLLVLFLDNNVYFFVRNEVFSYDISNLDVIFLKIKAFLFTHQFLQADSLIFQDTELHTQESSFSKELYIFCEERNIDAEFSLIFDDGQDFKILEDFIFNHPSLPFITNDVFHENLTELFSKIKPHF